MNKRLKRMVSAVLLILALGLAACDQVSELKEVSNSTAKEEQVSTEQVAAKNETVNTVIGSWEDDKEVVTFNSDGTYEASYYWWSGTYRVDETNSIITLVEDEDSKKEYYYTIDGDMLILQKGTVCMEFTRTEYDYEYEEDAGYEAAENENVNPIIGIWENDKDVVTFNEDGTYEASYYWWGGTYRVDETNSIITIVSKLSGKKEYYYTLENDTLILQNISNGKIGSVRLEFTRAEADSAFYPIIGTWENDKEVITFNSNGTFEASYYWLGGTYRVDETHYELTLVADVNGKDKYFFIIDGDTLKLFGLNSKGQTTDRELVFTRVE